MTTENISFAVSELYTDGRESEERIVDISLEEANIALQLLGYGVYDTIHDFGIILIIFKKLYNFTIGLNGFIIKWQDNNKHKGFLHWGGPRLPACQIGGNWWSIKRI